MIRLLLLVSVLCGVRASLFYDSYNGVPISLSAVKRHEKANTTFWCVNEIKPCNPLEGRRVDGSCNNLQYPSRGASHTPFTRMLPPVYDKNYEPKKSATGRELPLPRTVRTFSISSGKVPSPTFTQLATHFFVFMAADVGACLTHDARNYIDRTPSCCDPKCKKDYKCIPNKIPVNDPVHRFSGHRCLNNTRPETFQSVGCIQKNTIPARIMTATPLLDLSTIYGNVQKNLQQKGRLFKGGLLKYEVENGKIWPPSSKSKTNACTLNQPPHEKRCHAMPEESSNTVAGINLFSIWFWRHHNHVARQLARINPCWNDQKLFNTARDINIAVALQIYYYELLPLFLGSENMVKDAIISSTGEFRDIYDKNVIPQLSMEYPLALRWLHSVQGGSLKLYDQNGYYLRQYPAVNMTTRTGILPNDNFIDQLTQGSFRQACGNIDYIADPDITDQGLGPLQRVSDLMTNDLSKSRYLGFQPYVKYREVCFGKRIRSFDDLRGIIDPERIDILREMYGCVEDIDVLVGMWLEKFVHGGYVPSTHYCFVKDQLRRNIVSDRHWYERKNRPHAYTRQQLAEIRKITIARVLCNVGDTVTQIQPSAFKRPGSKNRICSCKEIPGINYRAWKDPKCDKPRYGEYRQ